MFRKIAVAVMLLALVSCLYNCTKTVRMLPGEEIPVTSKIIAVVMPDGSETRFVREGATYDAATKQIVGVNVRGRQVQIPLEEILYLRIKKVDLVESTLAVVGVLALAVLVTGIIIAATKESCPFVYAWDGRQYVLDAEPLGGAVCEGMKRSESSRLERIIPDDGKFRLLVQNEVAEIQYLDQIQLQVVDHPKGQQVAPDQYDNLFTVEGPQTPVAAFDENGRDLLPFVTATDGIAWQSKLPVSAPAELPMMRHHHTYEFVRPAGATSARLVFNIGTTLWGSNMIREMLQLRGTAVDQWYEAVKARGAEYEQLQDFLIREQIWHLGVGVNAGGTMQTQGYIRGAGPLVVEDRVMDLDLSDTEGDTLTIHLTPPYGFWVIDYMAVQYELPPSPDVTVVGLSSASNH